MVNILTKANYVIKYKLNNYFLMEWFSIVRMPPHWWPHKHMFNSTVKRIHCYC